MRARWGRASEELTLDAATLTALINPAFPGQTVLEATPARGGLTNTNLRLRLSGLAEPVLLRLYTRDPTAAVKEQALHRRLAPRLPVPQLLFGATDSLVGHAYALMAWVDGERLELVAPHLGHAELGQLGRDVGRVLAGIHAVTFSAQGFLDGGLEVQPFPAAFGAGLVGFLRAHLVGTGGAERLGADLTRRLLQFAERESSRLAAWTGPPCLTHADFGPSNILVRRAATGPVVAAVLDWEFAFSGAPFFDFGNLLRPPVGDLPGFEAAVASGYRAAGGVLPRDWRRRSLLVDLTAWAEFLSRPHVSASLVRDARAVIARTIARWPDYETASEQRSSSM